MGERRLNLSGGFSASVALLAMPSGKEWSARDQEVWSGRGAVLRQASIYLIIS